MPRIWFGSGFGFALCAFVRSPQVETGEKVNQGIPAGRDTTSAALPELINQLRPCRLAEAQHGMGAMMNSGTKHQTQVNELWAM
uniref:Secreted protein n=1 Tax=Oryza brachyantha TaxID=4533 RepID=J3L5D7_ORYBR